MTYTVRYAEMRDKEWVIDEAAKRTIFEDLQKPELFNPTQLGKLFDIAILGEHSYICEKDGQPIGLVAGIQHGHIFNPEVLMISTLFWYVLPEHRTGRAAYQLISSYKKSVDMVGLECVFAIQEYSQAKANTFLRLGFTHGEGVFKYAGK